MNDMFHANEVNFFYHALFSPTRSMERQEGENYASCRNRGEDYR